MTDTDEGKVTRFVKPLPADALKLSGYVVTVPITLKEILATGLSELQLVFPDDSTILTLNLRMDGERLVSAEAKIFEQKLPPELTGKRP